MYDIEKAPTEKRGALRLRKRGCFEPSNRMALLGAAAFVFLVGEPAAAQTPESTVNGPPATQSGTPGAPAQVTEVSPRPGTSFFSTLSFNGVIDAGGYGNPANPRDNLNFGQFNDDKANEPTLNQVLLTLTRPVGADAKSYDFGFTIQGLFGSDARFLHILGLGDHVLPNRYQLIPTQALVLAHLPWFTPGGVDVKAGLVPGFQGYEALDPSQRQFYSLTYTSYYLLPADHIGVQATIHINSIFDFLIGIDTGNQTSFGINDNNGVPAGYIGFALNNILDKKLTVTAVERLGPEDQRLLYADPDRLDRSISDIVAAYKYNEKLTLTGETTVFYDQGIPGHTSYGFSGFAAYVINDRLVFNGRAEVLRDNTGVIVGDFLSDTGDIDGIRGLPIPFEIAPSPTTFGALTANVVYKPDIDWKSYSLPIKTLSLRPEIRYDRSLNGTNAFDVDQKKDQFLFGGDIIVNF